jgi:hypothetical protein
MLARVMMTIAPINTMTVVLIAVSCRRVGVAMTRASQLDYRVTSTVVRSI